MHRERKVVKNAGGREIELVTSLRKGGLLIFPEKEEGGTCDLQGCLISEMLAVEKKNPLKELHIRKGQIKSLSGTQGENR